MEFCTNDLKLDYMFIDTEGILEGYLIYVISNLIIK